MQQTQRDKSIEGLQPISESRGSESSGPSVWILSSSCSPLLANTLGASKRNVVIGKRKRRSCKSEREDLLLEEEESGLTEAESIHDQSVLEKEKSLEQSKEEMALKKEENQVLLEGQTFKSQGQQIRSNEAILTSDRIQDKQNESSSQDCFEELSYTAKYLKASTTLSKRLRTYHERYSDYLVYLVSNSSEAFAQQNFQCSPQQEKQAAYKFKFTPPNYFEDLMDQNEDSNVMTPQFGSFRCASRNDAGKVSCSQRWSIQETTSRLKELISQEPEQMLEEPSLAKRETRCDSLYSSMSSEGDDCQRDA